MVCDTIENKWDNDSKRKNKKKELKDQRKIEQIFNNPIDSFQAHSNDKWKMFF